MSEPGGPVLVWDWPVRLFHWAIVVLMPVMYVTWKFGWMDWHVLAGKVVLALVVFRVAWGLVGGDSARFAGFLRPPMIVLRYLGRIGRREADRQMGHNPAGGWMVAVMLGLLLVETLSGVFTQNDVADEGPFTETLPAPVLNFISDLHSIVWDVLLAAIVLHLCAIGFYAVVKGQNLVGAMMTGRKRVGAGVTAPRAGNGWVAGVVFVGAVGVAWGIAGYL